MLRKIDRFSFGSGILAAVLVACAIGAAANIQVAEHRYGAATIMGGLGLQIVDHNTNTMYHYRRDKLDDSFVYLLYETVDLTKAGDERIEPKGISHD